jgi:hypothetical protein
VLNSAISARRLRRAGPATGHRSDPDWRPEAEDLDDELDADDEPSRKAVVVSAKADADAEPDYLDVDVVEDSGALPAGSGETAEEDEPELVEEAGEEAAEPVAATDEDGTSEEYEYVEDTSGLESGHEPPTTDWPADSRRRRYESKTAAVIARKYEFRKRAVSVLAGSIVLTAMLALTVWPDGWWACGTASTVTLLYLAYLRRQTRIEERLRRRRAQRMARSRVGVENTADRAFDVVPSRLRRPGSVVLEIDDEDPMFEHLDDAPGSYGYHLSRASGQ